MKFGFSRRGCFPSSANRFPVCFISYDKSAGSSIDPAPRSNLSSPFSPKLLHTRHLNLPIITALRRILESMIGSALISSATFSAFRPDQAWAFNAAFAVDSACHLGPGEPENNFPASQMVQSELNHFRINTKSPKSSSNFVDFMHQKAPFRHPNRPSWPRVLIRSFHRLRTIGILNCRQESDSVEIVHGRL
jgi:hypothetical protein